VLSPLNDGLPVRCRQTDNVVVDPGESL